MNTKENVSLRLKQFIEQRNFYLSEIYRVTSEFTFKGNETDAESYDRLITFREHLLDDLKIANLKLKSHLHQHPEENSEAKDFIFEKDKEADFFARNTIEMTNEINKKLEKTKFDLKGMIKDVKNTKNLNNAYMSEYSGYKEISNFDRQN